MFVGALFGAVLFLIVAIIPKFRNVAIEKGKKAIDGFMYKGMIRSF